MAFSPPQAHSTLDLEASEFDISETNLESPASSRAPLSANTNGKLGVSSAKKSTNNGNRLGDILSPHIPTPEVNRHFANFTYNNTNFDFSDDSMMDASIELGRGKTRNLSVRYSRRASSSSASSSSSTAGSRKVTDKRPTPKVSDGKYDFVIPTAYRDDESFFEGMNNNENGDINNKAVNGKAAPSERKSNTNNKNNKNLNDMNLPDITGLSSIFSSDAASGFKRSKNSHKQIVSVPIDPDDQALFTAFGSFQKKVEQLETDKKGLLSRVSDLEAEMKELKAAYDKEVTRSDEMEQRARKYKQMAIVLKNQRPSEGNEQWKEQQLLDQAQAQNSQKPHEPHSQPQVRSQQATTEPNQHEHHQSSGSVQKSAQVPGGSELDQIKQLLTQLLEKESNQGRATVQEEQIDHEQDESPQKDGESPRSDYNDSIVEALNEVIDKIKSSSRVSGQAPDPRSQQHQDLSSKGASNTASAKPSRQIPKLVDRVIESLPPSCEVCSSAGPKSGSSVWSAACTHQLSQDKQQSRRNHAAGSDGQYSWENEETVRPAMSAEESVKLIRDGMRQEFEALREQCNALTSDYTGHDPARERRRRQDAAGSLKDLVNKMETKADQIYALYDVMAEKDIHVESEGEADDEFADHEDVQSSDVENADFLGKHEWIHT